MTPGETEALTEEAAPESLPSGLRLEDPSRVLEEGARWIREYLEESGQRRVILGLSGGVDSAVTALWTARAVGEEHLVVLALPCSREPERGVESLRDQAVGDAEKVAREIPGADFRVWDIGPTVAVEAWTSGLRSALAAEGEPGEDVVALGNLQARVRAVRIRTLANRLQGLVAGTGNLSERLLGYFTLGGDDQADVSLLAELLKAHVYQLAEELGVPEAVRRKPPSAGLWAGQTDEDELGYGYDEADRVLVRILPHLRRDRAGPIPPEVRRELEGDGVPGVEPGVVRSVLERVEATEFKRTPTAAFPGPRER